MTEITDVRAPAVKALRALGIWVIVTAVKGKRGKSTLATGEPGMPDLYLPGLGHIETKARGGKLSPAQIAWHARARAAGLRVATADSAGEVVRVAVGWRNEALHERSMGWR